MRNKPEGHMLKARVGSKVLAQADQYFTNTLDGIAIELLQNSRRAGASRVSVTVDQKNERIWVADNGRGLASNDAGVLLTFGGSLNDDATEYDETPAGMGFFSLARRGAIVRSKDWMVEIPPEAFKGHAEATMEFGLPDVSGMIINFPHPIRDKRSAQSARASFAEAARAMPFATTVDDVPVKRRLPTDIFADADRVVSRIVGDCSIVVGRFESPSRAGLPLRPAHEADAPEQVQVVTDLFGLVVPLSAEAVSALHEQLDLFSERAVLVDVTEVAGAPRWRSATARHVVVLEALGPETLKAKLPDRQTLVWTADLEAVGVAIVEMIAGLLCLAPRNGLATRAPLRAFAADRGLQIPPPQITAVRPRMVDVNVMPEGRADMDTAFSEPRLVIDNGRVTYRDPLLPERAACLSSGEAILSMLVAAAEAPESGGLPDLLLEVQGAPGESVPGIDVVIGADLIIDGDVITIAHDGRFADHSIRRAWSASGRRPGLVRANSVALSLLTLGGNRLEAPLRFAILDAEGDVTTHGIVVTPRADVNVLVAALEHVAPWYQDCGVDGDGWVTQLERFRADTREVLRMALKTAEGYAAEKVADLVRALLEGRHGSVLARINVAFGNGVARVTATTTSGRATAILVRAARPAASVGRRRGRDR